MRLSFSTATDADVAAITDLRNAAAEQLARDFGPGHWCGMVTEKAVLNSLKASRTLLARSRGSIVATLRLATKKPWAIDASFFVPVNTSLYLVEMAVAPCRQRQGVGRQLLEAAVRIAHDWPADAIRLDAYDADAGAGGFYARCGFREVGRVKYRQTPLIYFERMIRG